MSTTALLRQVLVILIASQAMAWLLRACKQPGVIGEIGAGVILGPMVFGLFAPELHARLFEASTLTGLKALAEIGIVLFMFATGAELRPAVTAGMFGRAALTTGVCAFLVPLLCGTLLGVCLYEGFAPTGVSRTTFALFLGTALSITALPVMTRILADRALTSSPIGQLSLASAGICDVLSWSTLLLVATLARSDAGGWWSLGTQWLLLLLVCAFLLGVCRPALQAVSISSSSLRLSPFVRASILVIGLIGCACATDSIGVHSAIGALVFGMCVPVDDPVASETLFHARRLALLLFMPIFFAYAGLSCSPDALAHANLGAFAAVVAVAIAGKMTGAAAAARACGYDWRGALAVGTLMNARGLMELIAIRVGQDLGIINNTMFTTLLGMALMTTLLCAPLLSLLGKHSSVGVRPRADASAA